MKVGQYVRVKHATQLGTIGRVEYVREDGDLFIVCGGGAIYRTYAPNDVVLLPEVEQVERTARRERWLAEHEARAR